jgi:hypothetical protein
LREFCDWAAVNDQDEGHDCAAGRLSQPGSVACGFRRPLEVRWPPIGADAHSCEQKGPYSKNQYKKVPTHAPLLLLVSARKVGR